MSGYDFKDRRCWRLWQEAQPKGQAHYGAFAWRESPAGLERAWSKVTAGKTAEEVEALLLSCLNAAGAQTAYREAQLKAGERLPRPRGIAVWVNAGGWAEEVGSKRVGSPDPVDVQTCRYCSDPIVHAAYGTCAFHCPIPEPDSWRETLMRAREREVKAWMAEHKEPEETPVEFYRRVARIGWRKMKEKLQR